jgi:hypothetical protein
MNFKFTFFSDANDVSDNFNFSFFQVFLPDSEGGQLLVPHRRARREDDEPRRKFKTRKVFGRKKFTALTLKVTFVIHFPVILP